MADVSARPGAKVARALGRLNQLHDAGGSEREDRAWINKDTGAVVTEAHYWSDTWYGVEGFGDFDDPGPAWVLATRTITTHCTDWLRADGSA